MMTLAIAENSLLRLQTWALILSSLIPEQSVSIPQLSRSYQTSERGRRDALTSRIGPSYPRRIATTQPQTPITFLFFWTTLALKEQRVRHFPNGFPFWKSGRKHIFRKANQENVFAGLVRRWVSCYMYEVRVSSRTWSSFYRWKQTVLRDLWRMIYPFLIKFDSY